MKPSETEIKSIVRQLLPHDVIRELVKQSGIRLYWRLLTPLVLVWCFIYQRLSNDHTCDEVVSHLLAGGADDLSEKKRKKAPLSRQLQSESTSSYVQGRNRLPLSVLVGALHHVYQVIYGWLQDDAHHWKGHAVRLLDGTTVRLRPFGDLAETYGQAKNQHGTAYWVIVRVLAAFCLKSEALVAAAEGPMSTSESAMVREVMASDPEKNSIYVGDQGLGVYRTAQTAEALNHKVVLRIKKGMAKCLWKSSACDANTRCEHSVRLPLETPSLKDKAPLISFSEHNVIWKPTARIKVDPDLPREPIQGRLIYVRIEQDGFRPIDVYLFTTLLSCVEYPRKDICELYNLRWQVEIDLRQVKTTLEMEQFEVKSTEIFKKELTAGLLTYNLIRAFMVKAAIETDTEMIKLSFSRCFRRIRKVFVKGVPAFIKEGRELDYLLNRLAKCILPNQPNKVKHEPRKVRRKPAVFPQLRGTREDARNEVLQALAA